MGWDADIAASAQAWADNGVWAHSPKPRVINGENIGENLAWGGPTRSALHATVAWYDEILHTNPHGLASSTSGVGGETVGHYTQVVWKSTSKIGCGKARLTFGSTEGDVIVCQYGPAGTGMVSSKRMSWHQAWLRMLVVVIVMMTTMIRK